MTYLSDTSATRSQLLWIGFIMALIFFIVLIGGITRLTGSGLSMVQWQPLMGVIPPLSETDWQLTFEAYQNFPEYQKVNTHFTLSHFKQIFFWEYLHRMLGRLLGLVMVIPYLYFWMRKTLSKYLKRRLFIATLLVGAQGLLGWYMVQSGLVDRPSVSHFRLAAHLLMAFAVFQYLLWTLLTCLKPIQLLAHDHPKPRRWAKLIFIVLIMQLTYGAFTAGLDAGLGYNTFPKMGVTWLPVTWNELSPLWQNVINNRYMIQFIHRSLGWSLFFLIPGFTLLISKESFSKPQKISLYLASVAIICQFLIGILTLIHLVPLPLALAHQVGGLLVLSLWVGVLFAFRRSSVV